MAVSSDEIFLQMFLGCAKSQDLANQHLSTGARAQSHNREAIYRNVVTTGTSVSQGTGPGSMEGVTTRDHPNHCDFRSSAVHPASFQRTLSNQVQS